MTGPTSRVDLGPQVRKPRGDGWTREKRGRFLDHLAATCNIKASAEHVGMTARGVMMLRERDPAFAALWEKAMAQGHAMLEEELLKRALGEGDNPDDVDASRADASATPFDVEFALRLLTVRSTVRTKRGGRTNRPAYRDVPPDEVADLLEKRLDMIERRLRRDEQARCEPDPLGHPSSRT